MADITSQSQSIDQMFSTMELGPGTDFSPDREVSMPMPKRHVSSGMFSYISVHTGDSRVDQQSKRFQQEQTISAPSGNNYRFNDGSSSMASSQIDSFYNSQIPPSKDSGVRAFSMTDFEDGDNRSKYKFADYSGKSDEIQIIESSGSNVFASNHLVKNEPRFGDSMGLGNSSFKGDGASIIHRSQSAPLMESATWLQQMGQERSGLGHYHLSLSRPQNAQAHMMQAQISSGQSDSQMEPSYTAYTGAAPSRALGQQLRHANDSALMSYNRESMHTDRNEYPGGVVKPVVSLPTDLKTHLQDLDKRLEIRRGKVSGTTTALSGYSHQSHPSSQLSCGAGAVIQQHPQYQSGGRVQNLRAYATPSPSLESYVYSRHHSGKNSSSLGPPTSSPSLNLSSLEDSSVEDIVCKTCKEILVEAANNTLKAVELANTLRARVGTEVLAQVRERWGGLLALLERRSQVFRVERIPKNDLVSLIFVDQSTALSGGMLPQGSDMSRRNPTTSEMATVFAQPSFSITTAAPVASRVGQFLSMTAPYARQASPGLVDSVFHPGSVTLGRSGSAGTAGSPSPPLFLTEGGHSANPNANPSRCLHVGNVPPHLSESQLWVEFQQYGDVDGLKLVTQRNRRFAFVNYTTLEQAISAKQQMSKIQLWKSAISFAHKESYSGLISKGSTPSPGLPSRLSSASPRSDLVALSKSISDSTYMLNGESNFDFNTFQQHQSRSAADGWPMLAMPVPVSVSGPVLSTEHAASWYPSSSSASAAGPQASSSLALSLHDQLDINDTNGYSASSNYFNAVGKASVQSRISQSPYPSQNSRDFPEYRPEHQHQHQQHSMFQTLMRPASVDVFAHPQSQQDVKVQAQQRSQSATASSPSPHLLLVNSNNPSHPQLAKHHFSSPDSSATSSPPQGQSPLHSPSQPPPRLGSSGPAILRRLCDDTYVPTQLWPVDATADAPFCSAVISQLRQFGGGTTISKLRGFLRNRLAATDNIKSVPLKALLSAYPHLFLVNGNQVSLASSNGISPLLSSSSPSQNRQRTGSGGDSGSNLLVGVIAESEAVGKLNDRLGSALEDEGEEEFRRRTVELSGGRRHSDGEGVSLMQFGMSGGGLHSPSVSLNYSFSSRSLNSDTSSDSRGGGGSSVSSWHDQQGGGSAGGGRTLSINLNPNEFPFEVNESPLLQSQQHQGSAYPSFFSQQSMR